MAKKNIRKLPTGLLAKIQAFDQDDIVVACAKSIGVQDVQKYAALGVTLSAENKILLPEPQLPSSDAGRYSKANIEGKVLVRRDLPKVAKIFEMESPNWGEASNGTHTVTHTRMVYQRDFYPPKEVELSIELLEPRVDGSTVKFEIAEVLNRRTSGFEKALLYNLNLLQENVGAINVFPSAATLAEYAETARVDWQILPPGSVDEVVRGIVSRSRRVSPEQEEVVRERVSVLQGLRPDSYIAGTDGFLRYFGAKFADDFVVFENASYGNALYLMYESWEELSQLSRVELLSGDHRNFHRIEHRIGWQKQLAFRVDLYREKHR